MIDNHIFLLSSHTFYFIVIIDNRIITEIVNINKTVHINCAAFQKHTLFFIYYLLKRSDTIVQLIHLTFKCGT